MSSLLNRLDGWWRGTAPKGVTYVMRFVEYPERDLLKYNLEEFKTDTLEDSPGTKEVYSEAGYMSNGKMVLATAAGTTHELTCKSTALSRSEEGAIACRNGEVVREFVVSKFHMTVNIQNGGVDARTIPMDKDSVSWKKL
eukprot:TRINITY_DN20964_c0_g1_i1.p1 TRINITY_DN20964_c0_g1~~TRINITY_DN20964_c0_g1_i1.p1  ORF type:complete len:157 (+),score=25.30 TRINITY_DN20964_c0_g1_i1:53-472(+)